MFKTAAARARLEVLVPELRVVSVQWLSLFAYPLSGGFKPWSLCPPALVRPALVIEERALSVLGPLMGFRLMAVLERRSNEG